MIFYRSNHGSRDLTVPTVRTLSGLSLAAYPAGALVLALGPDTLVATLFGYTLILVALGVAAPLIGSSIQRIVGEEVRVLDEFEMRLRGRALSASYATFTGLGLLLVLYAAIASDVGGWLPDSYDEFNGVFWGVFLYASLLPTAILSWMVDRSFTGE